MNGSDNDELAQLYTCDGLFSVLSFCTVYVFKSVVTTIVVKHVLLYFRVLFCVAAIQGGSRNGPFYHHSYSR